MNEADIYIYLYKKDWEEQKRNQAQSKIANSVNNSKLSVAEISKIYQTQINKFKENFLKGFSENEKDAVLKELSNFFQESQKTENIVDKNTKNFLKNLESFLQDLGSTVILNSLTVSQLAFTKKKTYQKLQVTTEEIIDALKKVAEIKDQLDILNDSYKKIFSNKTGLFDLESYKRLSNNYKKIEKIVAKKPQNGSMNDTILLEVKEDLRVVSSLLNAQIRGDLNELANNIKYQAEREINKAFSEILSTSKNKGILEAQSASPAGTERENKKIAKADNLIEFKYETNDKSFFFNIGISEKSYKSSTLKSGKKGKFVATGVPWDRVMQHLDKRYIQDFANSIAHNKKLSPNSLLMQYILANNVVTFLMGDGLYQAQFINLGGQFFYLPDLILQEGRNLLSLVYNPPQQIVNKKIINSNEEPDILAKQRSIEVYRQVKKTTFSAKWNMNLK